VFLCGTLGNPDAVKLIDFGCAQLINGGSPSDGDTVAGTPEYMAPEQILCDPLDARTDIYSFGITLFRWLTGQLPFGSGPTLDLLAHQLTSPAPSRLVDDLPLGLERLVLTAMRKDPANRYATMVDLFTDLTSVMTGKCDVHGVPMIHKPDEYHPRSEQGKRTLRLLNQGASAASGV